MVTDQRTKPRQITPCRLFSLSNILLDGSSGAGVNSDLRDGLKIDAQQHFQAQFFITWTAFSLSLVLDGVASASRSIFIFAGCNVHLLIVLTISV